MEVAPWTIARYWLRSKRDSADEGGTFLHSRLREMRRQQGQIERNRNGVGPRRGLARTECARSIRLCGRSRRSHASVNRNRRRGALFVIAYGPATAPRTNQADRQGSLKWTPKRSSTP